MSIDDLQRPSGLHTFAHTYFLCPSGQDSRPLVLYSHFASAALFYLTCFSFVRYPIDGSVISAHVCIDTRGGEREGSGPVWVDTLPVPIIVIVLLVSTNPWTFSLDSVRKCREGRGNTRGRWVLRATPRIQGPPRMGHSTGEGARGRVVERCRSWPTLSIMAAMHCGCIVCCLSRVFAHLSRC